MFTDKGVREYVSTLDEVWHRLKFVGDTVTKKWNAGEDISLRDVEHASIQLRLACEGILFASYALHADFIDDVSYALRKGDKWDAIEKKLKKQNADYMPKPCRIEVDEEDTRHIIELDDLFISGKEIFRTWGQLSETLHYRNPLKGPLNIRDRAEETIKISIRIGKALANHTINIPDARAMYFMQAVKPDEENPGTFRWRRLMQIEKDGQQKRGSVKDRCTDDSDDSASSPAEVLPKLPLRTPFTPSGKGTSRAHIAQAPQLNRRERRKLNSMRKSKK